MEKYLSMYYGRIALTEYDHKPPACNSPHMRVINGRLHRVHFGGDFRAGRQNPSAWRVHNEDENIFPRKPNKYLCDMSKL